MTTQKCRLYVIYRHVWNMNCNVTPCLLANPKLAMVGSLSRNQKHCAAWVAIVVGVATSLTLSEFCWQHNRLAVVKFSMPSLCDKVSGGSNWRYPIFLNTVYDMCESLGAKIPLDSSHHFPHITSLWQADRQTEGHMTTAYITLA